MLRRFRMLVLGEIKPVTLDDALRSLGRICHHLSCIGHVTCTVLQNSSGGVLPIDSRCVTLAYTRT